MTDWAYKIPTLNEAPKNLLVGSRALYTEDMDRPRLGLFCEEPSHEGQPWFICSFIPNYAYLEASGELVWTTSNNYRTGSGDLLRVAYLVQQLISEDNKLAPYNANGIPIVGEKWNTGRGRWDFECKSCGNKATLRTESFQKAVPALLKAGIMEISLTGLRSMISRVSS